jgi:hypothetical protein
MASGPKSVVVGYNHNVKYRGQTYHAQTEDTGSDRAQIVTHLFLGGNIVASKRTSYSDIAGAENLPDVVRALMEEQHKEVLRNLVHGVYDHAALPRSPVRDLLPEAASPAPPAEPRAAEPPPRETPVDPRNTLFGEDLISERTLDEVILAYLAGEDGTRRR